MDELILAIKEYNLKLDGKVLDAMDALDKVYRIANAIGVPRWKLLKMIDKEIRESVQSDYMNERRSRRVSALKSMRQSRSLSQRQLAEKANVDVRMIQHYEQGFKDINKANVLTVLRLAEALDCDVYDILNPRDD